MNNRKSGSGTLLWSVIMSSPGPLVVGLGLLSGRSSTQIADFFRRSSELLAIIMSFIVYRITTKESGCDERRKARLEKNSNIFVGTMMLIGGMLMFAICFMSESSDKGNVIPGLVIAILGVIANTVFCIRYTRLNRSEPNAILAIQARLYLAKSLVDGCVCTALMSVFLLPDSAVSVFLDMAGSVIVSVYLIYCGIRTIREEIRK